MIKIDLLKELDAAAVAPAQKKMSMGKKVALSFSVLIAAGSGLSLWYISRPRLPAAEMEKGTSYRILEAPSRYVNTVEETVDDFREKGYPQQSGGLLTLPYAKMSEREKVLYGSTFLQRTLHLIADLSGSGIELNRITVEGFTDFHIIGVADSRTIFNRFRKKLKEDPCVIRSRVTIKRSSKILPGQVLFDVKGKLELGLDYARLQNDPGLRDIPGDSELLPAVRKFRDEGKKSGVKWTQMKRSGMKKVSGYREHYIVLTGYSSYKKMVSFFDEILKLKSVISFPMWTIQANDMRNVTVKARAVFYTQPD